MGVGEMRRGETVSEALEFKRPIPNDCLAFASSALHHVLPQVCINFVGSRSMAPPS